MSIQHVCAICGKQVARKQYLLCSECYETYKDETAPWFVFLKQQEQTRRRAAWRSKDGDGEAIPFSSLTTRELDHARKI